MSCRITGKICDAWSDVAGCGLVRCKFVKKKDGSKILNSETVTNRHQMTNADRIRAMRDEEIAEASSFRFCPSEKTDKSCVFRNCKECWIEWLQKPAEEMLADEATEGGDD